MRKENPKILVAVCVFIMALTGPTAEGKLITVDDDAPANYSIIQDAVNFASDGDEIEVRPGTYYQTVNFKGKSIRLYSRDGSAVTIIDATGLNSSVVDCNSSEDANTILEGFTITGGNAVKGGGMHIIGSSPTVTNCIYTGNTADYGGGIYNEAAGPTVTDCNFIDNIATYSGGGMYSKNDSNSILTNCIFSGNSASSVGGGMCNSVNSNPTLTNCTFRGNSADLWGGGMRNESSSSPTVNNCNFIDNIATYSGGGMNNTVASATVTNCTFSGNTTTSWGGGMTNWNDLGSIITNCTFRDNDSTDDGGGMYNYDSNPTVTNCIFWNNSASYGGGMHNYLNSSPTLTNCTFSKNTCVNYGGGILNNSSSSPTVMNCILWGNTPDQINDWDSPASTTTVSFSDVEGGWPGGVVVIDSDPFFVDAVGGDLRLSSSASPCVDMGAIITPGLPATDLAGNPRIVDGDRNGTVVVDMGAYEYQSWLIHNITQDNWYETIQAAIDAAVTGDEIEVAPGTYYEAINFIGKAIRLYSAAGPNDTIIDGTGNYHVVQCVSGEGPNTILEGFTITGGYANGGWPENNGGGMFNAGSSPTVTNCIFTGNRGQIDGGGMYNRVGSSPTVTNCIFKDNIANNGSGMLNIANSNPMVTNCTFSDNWAAYDGGGMYSHQSNPAVTECDFSNNSANWGGGMYNFQCSPTVTDCSFSNNSAVVGGGGGMINYDNSYTRVSNCTFSGNNAAANGGGMWNGNGSNPDVTNCRFSENEAGAYGGGMYNDGSLPKLTNCIFNHNIAVQALGGGIANYNSSHSTVTNCTFSGNKTGGVGGGIRNWDSSPTVTNCILWDNEPDEISSAGASVPAVNYSDIQGGHIGTGNINTDPNFVDANNPDPNLVNLRLLPVSACIDAGDTTAVPSGIFVDVDGNPRGLDDPASPDTGINVLGVTVDMGAYELQPCPIPGDVNCDGVVDFRDVAILCNDWLAGTEPEL